MRPSEERGSHSPTPIASDSKPWGLACVPLCSNSGLVRTQSRQEAAQGTEHPAPSLPPNALRWQTPLRRLCAMLSRFSRAPCCATLWTEAHQAPLSMGFSRHKYWRGLPFPSPGDPPDSGSNQHPLRLTCIGRRVLYP